MVGDARSLPFAPGSFDVVILHLILAVAPEPERIVAEVDRVLVPGGTVSIFDKFLPAGNPPPVWAAAWPIGWRHSRFLN